jgi:hypothetical protein
MKMADRCTGIKVFVLLFVSGAVAHAQPSPTGPTTHKLQAALEQDKITITVDGRLFTCYKFAHTQKYPYFWPVNGPVSNQSVTTETCEPYPHHHSLFFGCDRVNGGNYWQDSNERGQILSEGPKLVAPSGDKVVFTDECLWRQPGKEPVMRDERRIVRYSRLSRPNS